MRFTSFKSLAIAISAMVLAGAGVAGAGLISGGTGKSDCYVGIDVAGVENGTSSVEGNRKILCVDGDACDTGACGDGACAMSVAVCWNQVDPRVPACNPPAGVDRLTVKKSIAPSLPPILQGDGCSPPAAVTVKTTKNGRKPGRLKITATAKAPKGTKPSKDRDTFILECRPRIGACPVVTTTTTTTTSTNPPATTTTQPPPTTVPSTSTTVPTTTIATTTTTTLPSLCAGGEANGSLDQGEECDSVLTPTVGCSPRCTCCGPVGGSCTCTSNADCGTSGLCQSGLCIDGDDNKVTCTSNATCTAAGSVCRGCLAPEHPRVTPGADQCDDGNATSGDGCDQNCTFTACGNGILTIGETCDDGNLKLDDFCPPDCVIDACTPNAGTDFTVTVSLVPAPGVEVGSYRLLLDFPEGKVRIPGGTPDVPAGIITDTPPDTLGDNTNLYHALLENRFTSFGDPIPAGVVFKVHFETCAGAPAPTAGEFSCVVPSAFATDNITQVPASCTVSIP